MIKPSYELELYKGYFSHVLSETGVLSKVLHVLEVIANSKTGIGEVMQDYARQNSLQIKEIIRAKHRLLDGTPGDEDMEILDHAGDVLKMVGRFLELIPSAMKRNNAATIGGKEKITAKDIKRISDMFVNSPETRDFLADEAAIGIFPAHQARI